MPNGVCSTDKLPRVHRSLRLSDVENVGVGMLAAFIEGVLLQPTLYWKNARAQGLPFTMKPSVVYRGTSTSILNEVQMMGLQFGLTGALQRAYLSFLLSKAVGDSEAKGATFSFRDEVIVATAFAGTRGCTGPPRPPMALWVRLT